jgi:hypothetical protein
MQTLFFVGAIQCAQPLFPALVAPEVVKRLAYPE